MYFDSHCHLDFEAFDGKRAQHWEDARAKGVTRALIPGVHRDQWQTLPALCADLEGVSYAVGLHPWWVRNDSSEEEVADALRAAARGACAIGELGLDRTKHATASIERQIAFVKLQLAIANELSLPVILHCVQADNELLEVLQSNRPAFGGVVHSFSGSAEMAKRYLKLGLHVSFSCSALRFSEKKNAAIACVPRDRLLIETDAPDQSAKPDAHGSPLHVIEVAEHVASVRAVSTEEIARITYDNAARLFD